MGETLGPIRNQETASYVEHLMNSAYGVANHHIELCLVYPAAFRGIQDADHDRAFPASLG